MKIFKLKFVLSTALLLGVIGISNAQLDKGDLMLGADLGSGLGTTTSSGLLGFNFGLNDGAGFNLGLSPKVGYFVADNLLLGGILNFGYAKSPETNGIASETTTYGIQGLLRYYLFPGQAGINSISKSGRFFVEFNTGIAGFNVKDGSSTNGLTLGIGPGYSYFITENVALESSLKYNGLAGGGDTNFRSNIGINLGIQVFLPSAKAREIIED